MDIIITGTSRGIGLELVKLFSQHEGNRILAISRHTDSLNHLVSKVNATLIPFQADIAGFDFPEKLHALVVQYDLKPSILINNAGLLINKPFQDFQPSDYESMFQVNVYAAFRLIQLLMLRFTKDAHIVNIGSMGGFQGSVKFPGLSLYSASKAALAALTESLAEELQPMNIKINCLALGSAQTEMLQEAFPGYQAAVSASQMAEFIHHFALTGSAYMNGKVIPVAGNNP